MDQTSLSCVAEKPGVSKRDLAVRRVAMNARTETESERENMPRCNCVPFLAILTVCLRLVAGMVCRSCVVRRYHRRVVGVAKFSAKGGAGPRRD